MHNQSEQAETEAEAETETETEAEAMLSRQPLAAGTWPQYSVHLQRAPPTPAAPTVTLASAASSKYHKF